MFQQALAMICKDKEVYLPSVGNTSCSGISTAFTNCREYFGNTIQEYECNKLKYLSMYCYLSTDENITTYIQNKIQKKKDLDNFLSQNKSTIPERKQIIGAIDIFEDKEKPET